MPMSSSAPTLSSRNAMPPANAAARVVRAAPGPSASERARSSASISTTSSRAASGSAAASSTSTVPAKRPIASVRTQGSQATSTKRPHPEPQQAASTLSRPTSRAREASQPQTTQRPRSKTPVQPIREREKREREMSLDQLAQGPPPLSLPQLTSSKRAAVGGTSDRRRHVFQQIKQDLQRSEGDGISIFPAIPTCPPDRHYLQRRLIRLTEGYLAPEIGDLTSASFYSFLILTLFPGSIDARRLRAKCLLLAGQGAVFPYLLERSQKAGAASALAVLEEGPLAVFGDLGCAQIWSEACKALGRRSEAEEVLAWCLQDRAGSSSSQIDSDVGDLPELVTLEDRIASAGLTELGCLQKEARQLEAATHHFLEARKRDPWNWRAWVGLCELDSAPDTKEAFPSSDVKHSPKDFLNAVIQSFGGEVTLESEAESETTLPGTRTVAPVPQTKTEGSSGVQVPISSSQSSQRPGSRSTASATSTKTNGVVTAKRSKATPNTASTTKRPVFGPGRAAAAFGIEGGGAEQQRSNTVNSRPLKPTTMTRTLSQARTNERPLSSLSSTSRSTVSEKEKSQPAKDLSPNVTRDSLRRSTRSAITTPATSIRRTVSSRSNSAVSINGRTGGTEARSGSVHSSASRTRKVEQPSSESDTLGSLRQTPVPQPLPAGAAPKKRPAEANTDDAAQLLRVLTLKKAAEEAAKWRSTDLELSQYVRLMAGFYKEARGVHGRRALDLLSYHQAVGITEASLRLFHGSAEVGVLLGRVHHDMAQYTEAEQCFHNVLKHHGKTMEGMDIFSLVLFHLNRHERLSALAQELNALDSDAVETHIAIGNLFSLNASPSIALRSFRRACLSAPNYAYSFTLAGHECLALNQPLKALRFFREAVRIDPRHWNGWSGIASILASEEKFDEARLAINRACALNRYNSGLWEVMGALNEQKEDFGMALTAYSAALASNPKSSSACLRRAELLWKMGKFEDAHFALLQVVALLPNEPRAHLLLAESYMRKGGGRFAPMAMSRSSRPSGPSAHDPMNVKAKAIGEPRAPIRYQEEISRHLAIAVDLEPALNRRVKAMAEGVSATLRGQTSGSGGGVAGQGSLPPGAEASIGSSFAGVDESRHPYSMDEEEGGGGGAGEGSYSYGSVGAIGDSIGVLRDEHLDQSGMDHQMSEEASGSGVQEGEGEDEENRDRSAESLLQQEQIEEEEEEEEQEEQALEMEDEEEMEVGEESEGDRVEGDGEGSQDEYPQVGDAGNDDSGAGEEGGSEVEMSLE